MSSGPIAYVNGRFVPAEQATVPLTDAGFVLGATVTEQLRTFRGRLFRLDEHLARLERSLAIVDVHPPESSSELAAATNQLAAHNHGLLDPDDDLGLAMLVTPGTYAAFAGGATSRPFVCLHTYPLPFGSWAEKYRTGQALATTSIEQVSPRSWPPELKCRSRMHYYLADLAARRGDPAARAVLLDSTGHVCETATANLVLYSASEGFVSPPRTVILPGISLAAVRDLAAELSVPWSERRLLPRDVIAADEALLTSTPYCLTAATTLDGRSIGTGAPGPMFRELIESWGRRQGLDIVEQARRFSHR